MGHEALSQHRRKIIAIFAHRQSYMIGATTGAIATCAGLVGGCVDNVNLALVSRASRAAGLMPKT